MTASVAQTRQSAQVAELEMSNPMVRALLAVSGGALVIAAFGLWLMPGASVQPALMMMKLGVSLFMLISGMCLVVVGREAGH